MESEVSRGPDIFINLAQGHNTTANKQPGLLLILSLVQKILTVEPSNLSTTATAEIKKRGHCREMANICSGNIYQTIL